LDVASPTALRRPASVALTRWRKMRPRVFTGVKRLWERINFRIFQSRSLKIRPLRHSGA